MVVIFVVAVAAACFFFFCVISIFVQNKLRKFKHPFYPYSKMSIASWKKYIDDLSKINKKKRTAF